MVSLYIVSLYSTGYIYHYLPCLINTKKIGIIIHGMLFAPKSIIGKKRAHVLLPGYQKSLMPKQRKLKIISVLLRDF